jgi:hypothetical protein
VELLTVEDYEGLYKSKLARQHKYSRLREDQRLWTHDDIAEADSSAHSPRSAGKKALAEIGPRKIAGGRKE